MSFEYENEERDEREIEISPEEFLALQKRSIRRKSFWALGVGAFLALVSLGATWLLVNSPEMLEDLQLEDKSFVSILFRNILFLLGSFFLAGGIWGLFHAKNLKIEDYISSPEAVEFIESIRDTKPLYTYILVGCLVAVTIFQLKTEDFESAFTVGSQSAKIAGLVKPLVWQGEWWRILTAATLHGIFPMHLYFNSQALFGFGGMIEALSNKAHLAIVFLLAVIGGGFLSLFYMTSTPSIGASGGIMGLIGYLAVYGYRRKNQLPPTFLKSMLINIGFIAAFGLIAYQIVDNFGHLGGLLVGLIYGFLQVPRDLKKDPRETNIVVKTLGAGCVAIFVGVCVYSILLLLKVF